VPARQPWDQHRAFAWILTALGATAFVGISVLAGAMLFPVHWPILSGYGQLALLFSLHLLLLVPPALGLGFLAWKRGARLPAALFALAALLVFPAAFVPVLAVFGSARQLNVSLSLADYLEHARTFNVGPPARERTVVFGVLGDGTKLELDVWWTGKPRLGPLRPAVLNVHGGAFTRGNRSATPEWNRWLNELGYEVFDVEYRLPPPPRFLDQVADVKAALGYIARHAAEYHVDPAAISVMGFSAGANLAMVAAFGMGDSRLPAAVDVPRVEVRCVINFYGPTDLALLYEQSSGPVYLRRALEAYLGGSPAAFPDRYALLSPLTHVTNRAPPTLTLMGKMDRTVPLLHTERLDRALANAGVPHETILLSGADHAFDTSWGAFATQVARAKLKQFLARCRTPGSAR
jgi:acetyl esterase/lipase